ncbi:MAG: hypothetical protein M1833_004815 [Piccolia ochrophora]|nr:MAG: hypothetical protein M1833_004815 [Piccolia ochrophora]
MPVTFFDLPREIRDEVYLRVYSRADYKGDYVEPPVARIDPFKEDPLIFYSVRHELLRTCRRMREEASPYLYGRLAFVLNAPHKSFQWLQTIGRSNWRCIRHVELVSTFLSSDINDAGRAVAANTWASILSGMPYLESIRFSHEEGGRGWNQIIHHDNHTALAAAFADLTALRSFSYERCYENGHRLNIGLLAGKASLEEVNSDERIVWPKGSSAESIFDGLPKLKALALSRGPSLSPTFFHHVAPLRELSWCDGSFSGHLRPIVSRHGATLRSFDFDHAYDYMEQPSTAELCWFLRELTALKDVSLRLPDIDTAIIDGLSGGLVTVDIRLHDFEQDALQARTRLLAMRNRCKALKSLSLACLNHEWDRLRDNDPFHDALREIEWTGVDVCCSTCQRRRCHLQSSADLTLGNEIISFSPF